MLSSALNQTLALAFMIATEHGAAEETPSARPGCECSSGETEIYVPANQSTGVDGGCKATKPTRFKKGIEELLC